MLKRRLTQRIEKIFTKYGNRRKTALMKLIFAALLEFSRKDGTVSGKLTNKGGTRVAIMMSGGVGDYVANALYVQEFSRMLRPGDRLDLFGKKSVIEGVFYGKDFVTNIIGGKVPPTFSSYDIVIELVRFPSLLHFNAAHLKFVKNDRLLKYIETIYEMSADKPFMSQTGYLYDFTGIEYTRVQGMTRCTQADIGGLLGLKDMPGFSMEYDQSAEGVFAASAGLERGKYFTLQRGSKNCAEETKLWPLEHYNELVRLLKQRLPGYKIVQLGRLNTTQVEGIDLDMRGKTSFEELKALLRHSALHIDCECGMVHMKKALGGRSAVMFGPTRMDFYGYPENINIRSDACPFYCEWLSKNWTEKCIRNFDPPLCMQSLKPEFAADRICSEF